MKNTEILIIGAGAAGLMAVYTLSKAGKKVTILEARERAGGRIHTIYDTYFFKQAELGAEFVHGNLPVTLKLLKEAGISYTSAEGEMWHYRKGKFSKEGEPEVDWELVMEKLGKLKEDISVGDFLDLNFAEDKYKALRESVSRFVSGYDTADPYKASAFAIREEWQNEDQGAQYRVQGGYGKVIEYLVKESKINGAEILLNSPVKDINWKNEKVEVTTSDGSIYNAEKVIIALPLGVLKQDDAVIFHPGIPVQKDAIHQMGFGAIIKVLLEFKDAFWEGEEADKLAKDDLSKMGFVLSDEEIPTWWTQYPEHSTVLTGWLGGPPAEKKKDLTNEEILDHSLQSLSNIFKKKPGTLKDNLVAWHIANWTTDPFTLGSYAYDMVTSHKGRKVLSKPVDDTIYFAGEYLYEGPAMGTVEAALTSGLRTAEKIIQ